MSTEPSPSTAAAAKILVETTLQRLVAGDSDLLSEASKPPAEAKPWLDDLLSKVDTYRDGMITLLAFPLAEGRVLDLTRTRPAGARSVSGAFATTLRVHDIRGRKDALQTIAKGSPNYMGRSRASWNDLLDWASNQSDTETIRRAWLYLLAGIAATARSLPPLPTIDSPRLTFVAVVGLVDELLETPSNGAVEQFAFAAMLSAYVEQLGIRTNERVVTKSLNAADASAGAAGDVQHMEGNQVIDAYEVTANDWQSKVHQAVEALRTHDLKHVHIVARAAAVSAEDLEGALPDPTPDISVLDLHHELHSLIHRLRKPSRRSALEQLYEHLVQRQPRDDLVELLVEMLRRRGLAA